MKRIRVFQKGISLGVIFAAAAAFANVQSVKSQNAARPLPEAAPAPSDNPTTPEKAELGRRLFFEPRLSGDNTVSCASCHLPEKAFTDGLPLDIAPLLGQSYSEISALVAFLESLNGEPPKISKPVLP